MEIITKEYLRKNLDVVFVFGDNLMRKGLGGAAMLRGEPNTYGFITKRRPDDSDSSFYRDEDYKEMFESELNLLKRQIEHNWKKMYLISRLGAGLANKYNIWEKVIEPRIKKELEGYDNVRFLF